MHSLIIIAIALLSSLQASVEHKDEFIDVYLSNISSNMQEKTEILEHIKNNLSGSFLDIGTGGDAIALIVKQLPKSARTILLAADLDPLVIDSIKKRRPEITAYLNSSSGPKVDLITMSATNMNRIKDSSLAGIGASALTHEVFSYTPVKGALDQFAEEVCRTLEKNGVFIYRDPKWVEEPEMRCTLVLKNDTAKYYASLFLTKFLDRTYSLIRDYRDVCCKPTLYSADNVIINATLKATNHAVRIPFQEFLATPSTNINYSKNFSIEAPKGLIAEIQRHYLMFLKDYFAAGLVGAAPGEKQLLLDNLSPDEREAIEGFARRKSLPIVQDTIQPQHYPALFKEVTILQQIFAEGLRLPLDQRRQLLEHVKKLTASDLNKNLFYLADDHTLVIDPKLLTLFFHGKDRGVFELFTEADNLPLDLLEHLKLEGEEHYFYKTVDELITYFGRFSKFSLRDSHKQGYILAPLDVAHIKEVPRPLYQSILERDMLVIDVYGNIQTPVTAKNIIHFALQPEQHAFAVYKELCAAEPKRYTALTEWIRYVENK